jgi:hypothetical protein
MNYRVRLRAICIVVTGTLSLWSMGALAADEYAKGIGALQIFDPDSIGTSPQWVQVWLGFMLLTFAASLIFVWRHPIARWVAGGFILGVVCGEFIFSTLGLPMLSGAIAIVHLVFWSPGLVFLLLKRPFLDTDETMLFRIWSGVMTAVILFSWIFDIRDAFIYIDHFGGLGLLA